MTNENTEFNKSQDFDSEAKGLSSAESGASNIGAIREVGMNSLAPFFNVIKDYKDDLNPYFAAIVKALQAGTDALNQESSTDADRSVRDLFQESVNWFEETRSKLESKNTKDLLNYIEEEAQRKPGLVFAISYLAGIGFGRLGKHMATTGKPNKSDKSANGIGSGSTIH